jgi:hypothetical protein
MSAWRRCVVVARGFLLLLTLAGCASVEGYPKRLDETQQYVTEVDAFVSPMAVLNYNAEVINPPPNVGPTQLIADRNTIVTARIYAIDVNYHNFVRDLTTQQNVGNIGADWVVLALNGVGATAGTAAAKAALAAASGGIVGARAAVSKDVFFNNTVPTLITTMEAQRKTALAKIYTGLTKSVSDYTIYQAMADLDAYYNAGTLNGALVQLASSASAMSQSADGDIAQSLSLSYAYDTAGQALRKIWKPDGKTIDPKGSSLILNCMIANHLNTRSVSALSYGNYGTVKNDIL